MHRWSKERGLWDQLGRRTVEAVRFAVLDATYNADAMIRYAITCYAALRYDTVSPQTFLSNSRSTPTPSIPRQPSIPLSPQRLLLLLLLAHHPPNLVRQNLHLALILPPRRVGPPHPYKPCKHPHLDLQPLNPGQLAVLRQRRILVQEGFVPVHGLRI